MKQKKGGVTHMKIKFTGSFGEFFVTALGLSILGILTFGLGFIYMAYWQFKYFFTHLEIEQ